MQNNYMITKDIRTSYKIYIHLRAASRPIPVPDFLQLLTTNIYVWSTFERC